MPSASGVWLRRVLGQGALVAYALVVSAVYLGQRRLQYDPARSSPGTPGDAKLPQARRVEVRTTDGLDLFAWYAPPALPSRPVILYFHGNSGHIGHRAFKARRFVEEGYGFYMCEYRGYGGNPGPPCRGSLPRVMARAVDTATCIGTEASGPFWSGWLTIELPRRPGRALPEYPSRAPQQLRHPRLR